LARGLNAGYELFKVKAETNSIVNPQNRVIMTVPTSFTVEIPTRHAKSHLFNAISFVYVWRKLIRYVYYTHCRYRLYSITSFTYNFYIKTTPLSKNKNQRPPAMTVSKFIRACYNGIQWTQAGISLSAIRPKAIVETVK